jgi:RNA polymerase sigma-70 factor, ECF subfamily
MNPRSPQPALGRDPGLFEAFYRRHVRAITGFVARRVTDPHLVDDLTTEVFLAAIEGADSFQPSRGSESAWLFGIARNVLAAERRQAARQADKMLRHAGRRPLDVDDISRLEEQIDAERASRALLAAVAELPPGPRAVIELVDIDGLTVTEAAVALGIPPVTARVRLHRARQALRRVPVPEPPHLLTVEGTR